MPTSIAPNVWIITSTTCSSVIKINVHLPWRSNLDSSKHRHPSTCSLITTSLQCCISVFPPTTTSLWTLWTYNVTLSLNTANLNVINISSLELRIWQYLEDHWNGTQLLSLGPYTISTLLINSANKLVSSNGPINPFMSTDESILAYRFCLDTMFLYRHLCIWL